MSAPSGALSAAGSIGLQGAAALASTARRLKDSKGPRCVELGVYNG